MEEWNFEEKYEIIEDLLGELNEKREIFKDQSEEEFFQPIFHMYDVMKKNALFVRDECRNFLEPAIEEMHLLADKLESGGGKLTKEEIKEGRDTFLMIGFEQDCLNALFMMNYELMDEFYKEYFPEEEREPEVSEMAKGYYIGPDVDFDKMPRLPSVLKVSDFEGKVNRLEWLVDHFIDDVNARIYLKARQDVRKKYKAKVKKVPVRVQAN
jgi:hypothetical protein